MTRRPIPYADACPFERPLPGQATAAREPSEHRVLNPGSSTGKDRQRIRYARTLRMMRERFGVQEHSDRS